MTRSIKKLLTTAAALSLTLPMMACASNDMPGTMTAADTVAAPIAPASGSPGLWKLADADTTIYMFGTVHLLRSETEWMTDPVRAAIASADQMVTEVDMASAQQEMQAAMPLAMLESGTLRELMSDENRAEFEAALTGLGLPVNAFDQFEPWFAALTLQSLPLMKEGFNPEAGVEAVVLENGGEGPERLALETMTEQFGFFDGLPLETQLAFLDMTAEQADEIVPMIDRIVEEWRVGDTDDLAMLVSEGMGERAVYDALLTRRNANWAEWIDGRMDQPGTVFIAVGAAHLAGDDSVQAMLAQRGITVERVQ